MVSEKFAAAAAAQAAAAADCGPTPGAHRIAAGGNLSPRRLQVGICFQPRLRTRSRAFTVAVSESGQLHQLSPRVSDSTASVPQQSPVSLCNQFLGMACLPKS
jgi:hypothetical protein